MLLTRSPLVYPQRGLTARLACVKHAASVRPEPGSNSPQKTLTKTQHKLAQTNQKKAQHTVEFSKDIHTPSHAAAKRYAPGLYSTVHPPDPGGSEGARGAIQRTGLIGGPIGALSYLSGTRWRELSYAAPIREVKSG